MGKRLRRSRFRTHSELHIRGLVALHSIFSLLSVLASEHFDEGMALVDVDDAGLD